MLSGNHSMLIIFNKEIFDKLFYQKYFMIGNANPI